MLCFVALAAAQSAPSVTEPILREAQADVRMLRRSRPLALAATTSPILFGLGQFSHISFLERVGSAKEGAGAAGPAIGTTSAIVGVGSAIWWMQNTRRSRRALEAQGLRPRKVPHIAGLLAVTGGVLSVVGWGLRGSVKTERAVRAAPWFTAVGGLSYGASLTLPWVQQRHNRRARTRAGWWAE